MAVLFARDNNPGEAGIGYVISVWDDKHAIDWIVFDEGSKPDFDRVRQFLSKHRPGYAFDGSNPGKIFKNWEDYVQDQETRWQ